ncbi:MAG: NADH-ubiquinone oxidoreductase-F iron-sulfur binding region domain-containing protein [Desulfobacterales bacterium]|nr:NADH-ubiquinone oxidoreductase-F iron-sulfur binding region domain-containing protein [Desulfobacterales bacterium]
MLSQVLLQNRKPSRITRIDEYRKSGGYEALARVLKNLSPRDVSNQVGEANLRGRGGAGFPAGRKWASVSEKGPFPRYLVTNADEMEPGTFKDRVLIHADPHMLIEGMIIAAYAVSASKGFLFVRPSYESIASIMEREVKIAEEAGYLGKNILGSGFSFEIVVHRSGGRYICGESSAMLNAIEGKRPNPRQSPPRSTEAGLWGKPTVVNNPETLANVPHIIRNGAGWFKDLARSETGSGTKLYCVSGRVNRPGCFELPIGTPLSELIEEHAGNMVAGHDFKTCLPGGASTRFLPRDLYNVELDFDPMINVGHRLGTGSVIVFDQNTCLVDATLNMTEFFARESCGWCTPCREGFPYLRDLLRRIENGEGEEEFIPLIRTLCDEMTNSFCAFAPGGISPVESLLEFFEDEVMEHIRKRKCPFKKK